MLSSLQIPYVQPVEEVLQPVLRAYRQANASVEAFFYPLQNLTRAERQYLAPHVISGEGGIVRVDPTSVRFPVSIEEIKAAGVRTLSMAGVGSSILGTAAMARMIAQVTGAPVAGIVSGKGLSNLMVEGISGYSFHLADMLDASFDHAPDTGASIDVSLVAPFRRREEVTLRDLLLALAQTAELRFVGHSRGALSIGRVLLALQSHELAPTLQNILSIVTFGAVTDIHKNYLYVRQFLGRIDPLGQSNSLMSGARTWVEMAGHPINPVVIMPMPFDTMLREALDRPERTNDTSKGLSIL